MEKVKIIRTASAQKQYEEAVARDRESIAATLRAPNLFNWFVGLNSIVSGGVLFLFSKIVENSSGGQFSGWIAPIQVALVLGGFGLLLSELTGKGSQLWKVVFRLVLSFSYAALALIWWRGGSYDGVLIGLWLSLVILFNVIADLSSLRSYLIFYQGLLVGLPVIILFFPANTVVGQTVARYLTNSFVTGLVLILLAAYIASSWWSYFRNKRTLSLIIGAASLPLAVLALQYANLSDWVGAFVILMTAIFALLVPFWDDVRFRLEKERQLVLRMFGVLLVLFLITILLIRVLQNVLITNTYSFLSDKVIYGRILADSTITNAAGSIRGLTENVDFAQAVSSGTTSELNQFSRTFFENNRSLLRIVAVDEVGTVLSVYPLSDGLVGTSVATETYFTRINAVDELVISDVVNPTLLGLGQRTIAISRPVLQNGRLVGGLIGFLDLNSLSDQLQAVATPASGQYFVVLDRGENWVIGPDGQEEHRVGDPLVDILIRRGSLAQGYAKSGLLTLSAESTMESTGWRMIVAQPLFAALAVNQSAYVVVLALVSISVLVVGLTILAEREASKKE